MSPVEEEYMELLQLIVNEQENIRAMMDKLAELAEGQSMAIMLPALVIYATTSIPAVLSKEQREIMRECLCMLIRTGEEGYL